MNKTHWIVVLWTIYWILIIIGIVNVLLNDIWALIINEKWINSKLNKQINSFFNCCFYEQFIGFW